MHKYKLNPELMERIAAIRQDLKWEPNIAIRIAESKEKAKEEDRQDNAEIKAYTDGSSFEGQIVAAAVLY